MHTYGQTGRDRRSKWQTTFNGCLTLCLLSVCLYFLLHVTCLSVFLPACYLFVCISTCMLPVCLYIYLHVTCLSAYIPACYLFVCIYSCMLPVCLHIYLHVTCLSAFITVCYLFVCISFISIALFYDYIPVGTEGGVSFLFFCGFRRIPPPPYSWYILRIDWQCVNIAE